MKLLVNNLGPIRNNTQSIDLNKTFYVFVGENNSGKTYLSQLLWGVYYYDLRPDKLLEKITDEMIEDWQFEHNNEEIITLTLTEDITIKLAQSFAQHISECLPSIFNLNNGERDKFLDTMISFEITKKDTMNAAFNQRIGANNQDGQLSYFQITKYSDSRQIQISTSIKTKRVKKLVLVHFLHSLLPQNTNIFLPANRQFYPIFYPYIFKIERDNSPIYSSHNILERPYTLPISELLNALFNLNLGAIEKEDYKHLLAGLGEIMGGKIATNRLEGIGLAKFGFEMKDSEKNIPLFLSSSAVNQLTLLYLYLKYWTSPDKNVLFIDEPEENLHPKNQIKLLELLIHFATQNSNKVFINTHSPLLAEALNNYMYINSLKEECGMSDADIETIMEENGLAYIDAKTSINKEKVGVYFFDGERIIDYETDSYGVFFRDFKAVTNSISKANRIFTDYLHLHPQAD